MFWLMLAMFLGSTVLSGLLQKAPQVSASSLGELQAPTAEEGRNLPVIFGTCQLKAPNVVWYGDFKTSAIKKSMGIMAFGRKATIGTRYFLGMDLALCHGQIDELVDILSGSGDTLKHINWHRTGTNADGSWAIQVDDANCFGGDEKEGGLSGNATFYLGSDAQQSNQYMSGKLGIIYPAYRGVCHMVLNQWYFGTSQYIKPIAIVARRCPSNLGLPANEANINGDANPAEMIYECIRNRKWGLGFTPDRFDIASFQASAHILASEGMGMSMMLDQPNDADATITTILQHIDGVCYTDPATGLWTLRLVRATDPNTLPEFGPSDIQECEFSRGSWDETVNEVKVKYTDRSTFQEAIAQAQETANYAIQGQLCSKEIDFLGFTNATIAQRACTRELRAQSYPIGQGRVKINRRGYKLRMGDGFLLTWPARDFARMPVRVTSINYGALESGTIEAEICEDIFNVAYTAYKVAEPTKWQAPAGEPIPPAAQLVEEMPYQLQGNSDRRLLCAAVRADSICDYFDVWSDDGAGFYQSNTQCSFCPSGLLLDDFLRTGPATDADGFKVAGVDLEDLTSTDQAGLQRGDNLLVIVGANGPEWCAWETIADNGDGTYTVRDIVRGIYDTFPLDHSAGERVYFVRNAGAFLLDLSRDSAYMVDQSIKIKMLPHSLRGAIAIDDVQECDLATASRAQKPYPPGKVQINGEYWPGGKHFADDTDALISWSHRNRTAQADCAIVAQDAESIATGPEGIYSVDVLVNGIIKRTQNGIVGTSFTYTTGQRYEDDNTQTLPVQVRITPVNGTLRGPARLTDPFYIRTAHVPIP